MSRIGCSVLIFLLVSIGAHAADVNVALNKPVILNGAFSEFVTTVGPCADPVLSPQKPASSIVDGIFVPELKCFQEGVYWNKQSRNTIDINLGGTFLLSSAIVQADADTFTLQYRDTAGVYRDWWFVPASGSSQGALVTRPNGGDQTQRQRLPSVLATGLRFFAPPVTSNGEDAVSEIQAFGSPVSVIDIGNRLVNPTFAGVAGACPTSWTCDGSPAPGFSSYTPDTGQYSAGSPFKTAGDSPTLLGGSGTIRQVAPLTWAAGSTYVLNLWKGLPKTLPNGTTPVAGWAPTARLYLATAAGERVAFEEVAAFDIPSPAKGTFEANPIIFTLPANSPFAGKKIAVVIFVSAPSGFSANFAIAPLFSEPSEVTGAAELATTFDFSRVQFSGWVNFSGAIGHMEMDMLIDGNASSSCTPSCDTVWRYAANFSVDLQPRSPVGDAGKQYNWNIDMDIPFGSWPVGGTQRFRFRPVVDSNKTLSTAPNQLLPVVESGFQHRRLEWILADTRFTVAETARELGRARPHFLEANNTVLDPQETLKYYKSVGTRGDGSSTSGNGDGTAQTIATTLSTKQDFIIRYFGSVTSLPEVAATYYNRGDLGIGRQMHCTYNYISHETACYVENYADPNGDGTKTGSFGKISDARIALDNRKPFATVAMVERGLMPFGAPNKVFFVVYGEGKDPTGVCPGELRCTAQLDTFGDNKSIPGNCMVCHGAKSTYSSKPSPQVTNAYFLPFDLQAFDYFSLDAKNPLSRAAQESAFKGLNQLAYKTDLHYNPDASDLINGWYPPRGSGATFQDNFVPDRWAANASDRRLYGQVVAPSCRTCHISHSFETDLAKAATPNPLRFATFDDFKSSIAEFLVCLSHPSFSMPNAEQTSNIFWQSQARGQLLDGLDSPSPCGLKPPTPRP